MSYVRELDVHYMAFEAGDLAGLEIHVVELSAAERFKLAEVDVENPLAALDMFIAKIDSWNLESQPGRLVPITVDGFLGRDLEFVQAVLRAWRTQVLPLEHGHAAAQQQALDDELVASLPMHAIPLAESA